MDKVKVFPKFSGATHDLFRDAHAHVAPESHVLSIYDDGSNRVIATYNKWAKIEYGYSDNEDSDNGRLASDE